MDFVYKESQKGVTKVVSLVKKMAETALSVSSPLRTDCITFNDNMTCSVFDQHLMD